MDPMLQAFINESKENLEVISKCFLDLEHDPQNSHILDELFRAVHTMKGSSGLFEISPFTKVVHAAEDVLDRVREGQIILTSEHVDLFLDSMDQVATWLEMLEETESLDSEAELLSQTISAQLRELLGESGNIEEAPAPEQQGVSECTALPSWLYALQHDARIAVYQQLLGAEQHAFIVTYTPEPSCFFNAEDPLNGILTCPGLVQYQVTAKDDVDINAVDFDPFMCHINLEALVICELAELAEHFKYVCEQVQFAQFDRQLLAFAEGQWLETQAYTLFIDEVNFSAINQDWAKFRQQTHAMHSVKAPSAFHASALEWLDIIAAEEIPNAIIVKQLLRSFTCGENDEQQRVNDNLLLNESEFNALTYAANVSDSNDADDSDDIDDDGDVTTKTARPTSVTALSTATAFAVSMETVDDIIATQRQVLSLHPSPNIGLVQSVYEVVARLQTHKPSPVFIEKPQFVALAPQAQLDSVNAMLTRYDDDAIASVSQPQPIELMNQTPSLVEPETVLDSNVTDNVPNDAVSSVARPGSDENTMAKTDKSTKARAQDKHASKTLKVEQGKIDTLMDLVGELVVAKNALPFLAKKAEEEFGVKALAKEIKSQYSVINRLSDEMQSAMMQVRMVPLSSVFSRFPRLVRDLSRKLNKDIQLILEGEDTEADKNVVEELSDPLIHLVRNSLDHGLETREERMAAGKPERGTIWLKAIPQDDQVVIEIVDDGRGIDANVIKQKAYEKGIIDEQRLDSISEQEALMLIFAAGFSTAEEISDISGRGVGMDVVRTVIQDAGGNVSVQSELGKGTTIRLSLPLSMAVTRIMMIEVSNQCYGINMQHIVETVKVPVNEVHRIKHNETLVLRGRVIPIFHLNALFGKTVDYGQTDEYSIIVILHNGQEVGLVIDEFHEGIDTIQKPLEGIMANYPYYAGTALLGDGRVLLVLDTQELLSCQ